MLLAQICAGTHFFVNMAAKRVRSNSFDEDNLPSSSMKRPKLLPAIGPSIAMPNFGDIYSAPNSPVRGPMDSDDEAVPPGSPEALLFSIPFPLSQTTATPVTPQRDQILTRPATPMSHVLQYTVSQ
ncbi:hypothetical protein C8J56DRAFT_1039253 [Mycena floridula]|nr:hypothetical protein C8J56DRAFT_1039253 [Mycena floridula]